jgi:hypothetical protein
MKMHEIKTDMGDFGHMQAYTKKSDVRLNDRGYMVGDYLFQRETKHSGENMKERGAPLIYTGQFLLSKITHIHTKQGMIDGWCSLSILILDKGIDPSD